MIKIDLHVHTKERSSCGRSTEEEQIQAAIAAGLDALVFSDHDRLAPRTRLQELNAKYAPFKIFGGIEVSIHTNEHPLGFEHLLVLGVQEPALERRGWTYPALYALVRQHGGFIALAHPFRFNPSIQLDLERFPPDALEAYSKNIPKEGAARLLSLAETLGVCVVSNSDAHHTGALGQYYNALPRPPANEQDLIAILRSGQFTCLFP